MARGNAILLNGVHYYGRRVWGFIAAAQTPKPGTIMQVDASVALKSNRHTFQIYSRGADGQRPRGCFWVLLDDKRQGKLATDAYAAGDLAEFYAPLPGDEINLLYLNVAGTADDVALNDVLIVDDTTGKVLVTTGSPQTEIACALEAYVDPTADKLLWTMISGY